jgi:hypothetical protein
MDKIIPSPSMRLRWFSLVVIGALITGCGTTGSGGPPTTPWKQVPVVSVTPMSDPQAQIACPSNSNPNEHRPNDAATPGFCVVYELDGQTYSVWLPTDPGGQLTLQLPPVVTATTAPIPAGTRYPMPYGSGPLLYPTVVYFGTYYRPRPFVVPVRPVGAPHRGRDGSRSRH